MRSRFSGSTKGRPTLIILDSHIGYGSPHKHDTAAAHGEPLGEEEVRLTKRAYGWPRMPNSSCPTAYANISPPASAPAANATRKHWNASFRRLSDANFPTSPSRSIKCNGGSFRPVGTAICRSFPRTRRASPGRDASGKVLNVAAAEHSLAAWRLGGSRTIEQDDAEIRRAPATSRPRPRRHETCISAFASTRWRRSSTGCRCRSCGRSAPRSSSSATMLGRRSASRR